ncbi:hypothetical protein KC930_04135 [Candidatus Saccharibacteria bacterium]|nr:hypothetical protein [Candidatus Saccharibacteria bacterium]
MDKKVFYLAGTVGTTIGGYLPILFGADGLSMWSILGGGIGGLLAIWVVYKLGNR